MKRRTQRLPLWSPIGFLRAIFVDPEAAGGMAQRWADAFAREPELAGDLIRLGGVLTSHPQRIEDGFEAPDPIDPLRIAYETGRRDMALKLLAAGNIGTREISALLGEIDD